jgi:hemoglobin
MTVGASPAAVDIAGRTDVHDLVVGFYREVVFDDLLAPVFSEVAEVDWAAHIPRLIDYWCRVLLGEPGYQGAIVTAHRHVHELDAFRLGHFDRWYQLWARSIDTTWHGPIAERAKRHAARIGASLARQLLRTEWQPADLGPTPDRIDPWRRSGSVPSSASGVAPGSASPADRERTDAR